MTTFLQISKQIMYVPGQGHVGVTLVCLIVVLHVKTLFLLIVLLLNLISILLRWFLSLYRYIACSQITCHSVLFVNELYCIIMYMYCVCRNSRLVVEEDDLKWLIN